MPLLALIARLHRRPARRALRDPGGRRTRSARSGRSCCWRPIRCSARCCFALQGRAVWRRFNTTLAEGAMPHREVIDGVLIVFGGAFLITPGFLTDIVGCCCSFPPTRALVRRSWSRRLGRRVAVVGGHRAAPAPGRGRDFDVEGTATEYEPPPAAGSSGERPARSRSRSSTRPTRSTGPPAPARRSCSRGARRRSLAEGPAIRAAGEGWHAELRGRAGARRRAGRRAAPSSAA